MESNYILGPLVSQITKKRHKPGSLEHMLVGKQEILQTKLDVLIVSIQQRFKIRDQNIEKIEEDKLKTTNQLLYFHPQYGAGVQGQNMTPSLYRQYMDLNQSSRREEADCWRDVMFVMRDLLQTWDSLQEAKNRAHFFGRK